MFITENYPDRAALNSKLTRLREVLEREAGQMIIDRSLPRHFTLFRGRLLSDRINGEFRLDARPNRIRCETRAPGTWDSSIALGAEDKPKRRYPRPCNRATRRYIVEDLIFRRFYTRNEMRRDEDCAQFRPLSGHTDIRIYTRDRAAMTLT